MSKGGYREGAGRPKAAHTIQAEAAKAELIKMFLLKKKGIFEMLIAQAEAGDRDARKELLERVWGKAVQPIGNANDKAFVVQWLSQSPTTRESGQESSTPA